MRCASRGGLSDQPRDDYYGHGSPLEKLCVEGGRVLRLEASSDTTVLRYAEDLADIPELVDAKSQKRRANCRIRDNSPRGPAS